MSDIQEALLMLAEHMEVQHNYFFNLIDVLAKKHIITKDDLEYIRYHKDAKEGAEVEPQESESKE